MSTLEASRWATFVASLFITGGLYHQVVKIWRTKSARDFTWTLVVAVLVNEVVWLNYGWQLHEWPVIAVPALNIPAAVLAVIGYWRYRK